jgi:hypothetical protein
LIRSRQLKGGIVDPNAVRFSQRSISFRFKDGRTVAELAVALKTGQVRPEDVPPLRLVEKEGEYFTLDNRRLEAFRRAGVAIPWRMATAEEIEQEAFKFTTTNGGVSIKVRGETP